MADHHPGRLPPGLPTRDRKRERHADEKRKRRLDKIVQRAPDPLDMRLLRSEESPNPALGQGLRHTLQPQHLRHHQEHDKAAVSIEGSEPRRRTDRRIINGGRRQRGGHALDLSRIASAVAKTNLGPNRGALSHAPTATSASPPVPTAGKPPLPSSRARTNTHGPLPSSRPAPAPTHRTNATLAITPPHRMFPISFFDWSVHSNRKIPIENRKSTFENLSGVFWILPLVGVRRCLSRVVGLSLNPLQKK